ncbi:hypothetical protein HERIO_560 [Hepatospora eriocheir]|uniref:DH domain-containing protein n=1 Tax=Hepatospora eriocheir TaxID=1081669 RepID=A0A1X0QCQ6_9MICR|nr:hypothetical protein HERIO_560 [Hepatospora eriocheir]
MSDNKKRIQALAEVFESERAYIRDIKFWGVDFKKHILNGNKLNTQMKYILNNLVFLNMHEILEMHLEMFDIMKKKNVVAAEKCGTKTTKDMIQKDDFILAKDGSLNVPKLEYVSLFEDFFEKMKVLYLKYTSELPRAIIELKKAMFYNSEFATDVKKFLKSNKAALGITNYQIRPPDKVIRYPLLLRAIAKREPNEELKNRYLEMALNLKNFVKILDQNFRLKFLSLEIYNLINRIKFKNDVDSYPLNLIYKSTNVLKDVKLVAKTSKLDPASFKQIMLFNNYMLICTVTDNPFKALEVLTKPLFYSKLTLIRKRYKEFEKAEELGSYHPLYLVNKETRDVKSLYFTNIFSRDSFHNYLMKLIVSIKSCLIDKYGLEQYYESDNVFKTVFYIDNQIEEVINIDIKVNEESINVDELSTIDSSSSEEWSEIIVKKEETTEIINVLNDDNKKGNWCTNCFKMPINRTDEIDESNLKFDKPNLRKQINSMELYSVKEGLFIKKNHTLEKISDFSPKKILYDSDNQLLYLLVNDTLYISVFNMNIELNFKRVNIKVKDIFTGKLNNKECIAITKQSDFNFVLIFLLEVVAKDNCNQLIMNRKLYVGYDIYDITFLTQRIVISCKDFINIDIDRLKSQALLEGYDLVTSIVLKNVGIMNARQIFKINEETFLLCFDKTGFYVDKLGCIKNTEVLFSWEVPIKYFKIYKDVLICLSDHYIQLFNLSNGKLVTLLVKSNCRFVSGTVIPYIYTENVIYKLEYLDSSEKKSMESINNDLNYYSSQNQELVNEYYLKEVSNQDWFNSIFDWYADNLTNIICEPIQSVLDLYLHDDSHEFSESSIITDIIDQYKIEYKNTKIVRLKLIDRKKS